MIKKLLAILINCIMISTPPILAQDIDSRLFPEIVPIHNNSKRAIKSITGKVYNEKKNVMKTDKGEVVSTYKAEYSEQGLPVKETTTMMWLIGNNSETNYNYDGKNVIMQKTRRETNFSSRFSNEPKDMQSSTRTTLMKNNKGSFSENHYDNFCTFTIRELVGDTIYQTIKDSEQKELSTTIETYNEKRQLTKKVIDTAHAKEKDEYNYIYNEKGWLTSFQMKTLKYGEIAISYWYNKEDKYGNWLIRRKYKGNKLMEIEERKIKYYGSFW